MSRRPSRRDLLKLAPLAGAGLAVGGLAGLGRGALTRQSRKGTCRFCLLHCGIEAISEGGRLVRVEGDLASHTRGFVCLHGYALPEIVQSERRLRAPLVRKGERLVEVSWAEALDFVARKLASLREQHGARTLAIQTGWPLVRHPMQQVLHRFARAFGTPNVASVASLCEASLRMAQALTVGSKYPPLSKDLQTLVLWGANPERSAPAKTPVLFRHAEAGSLVVVDPTRTVLAKRAAEHLQVRPGTDGALALGLAHVLVEERLYDAPFVAEHTEGFDAYRALVANYPPQRVEALTSVGAAQLVRTARRLAEHRPTRAWVGLGLEHHASGVQAARAVVSLEALLGSFDEAWARTQLTPPGEDFAREPLPALYRMRTPAPVPPPVSERPIGYDDYPLFEVFNREAQGNLFPRAISSGVPYPVKALVLMGSNALITGPGAAAMAQAADALELLVTIDPFLTESGRMSDVVLPASTFAEAPTVDERDAVSDQGLVAPQHGSWPDWKIVFELARALGLGRYFEFPDLKALLAAPQLPFMEDPAHELRPAPGAAGRFGTTSGKIELVSRVLEQFGQPGLPEYTPVAEPTDAEFPLTLVSGPRTAAYINSQFRKVPALEARLSTPVALLHPTAATRLGLRDGQQVTLVGRRGRVTLRLTLSDDVHPETVVAPAGWEQANVNALTGADHLDPISGFPTLRAVPCRIEPASS
ncbi:MAG: molybdopterin-dependent oxidoreductase [Myxococcaceae bacterium]|nr:molybdopterin-dependent oxidoreductase [Myxococcaceae bacterium]